MKQLTDAQYEQIGKAAMKAAVAPNGVHGIGTAGFRAAGRAAYEAAYPLAIEEALAEPDGVEWGYVAQDAHPDQVMRAKDGKAFLSWMAVRKFLTDRRARLTAKPDPAVELVEMMIAANHSAISIVAAVRASDAKAGRA